jgi:hypothetical protein
MEPITGFLKKLKIWALKHTSELIDEFIGAEEYKEPGYSFICIISRCVEHVHLLS